MTDALRRARADASGSTWRQASGLLSWSVRGRRVASISFYAVERDPGRPACVLRYTTGAGPVEDVITLAELPSNLGRGQVLYWRCVCGQLARILYHDPRRQRWRCRRCCPVVYTSSRESDRRVSALLAGELPQLVEPGPAPGPGASARAHARYLQSLDVSALGVLLAAARRQERYHGGQGQPWSAARRAAARRT